MRTCNCSNPATVKRQGAWICERCAKLDASAHVHKMEGIRDERKGYSQMDWDTYWTGDLTPIAGGSLIILEGWLAA